MHLRRFSSALLASTAILASIDRPVFAADFVPLNYFLNTTKGLGKATSCTAQVQNNTGTFNRTFSYSSPSCPGVPLYIWTKGAPQWAEEHFYSNGTFIKLLDDTFPMDESRNLFEQPYEHGLDVFYAGIVSDYMQINHPNWYVSLWEGNICPAIWQQTIGPLVGYDVNAWIGTVSSWLYDCRAGRPCRNGSAYPVEVIQRDGSWPGGTDHFWFARWRDPMDGNKWRGLGPIKFWCEGSPEACSSPSEYHYLKDCKVTPVCLACPAHDQPTEMWSNPQPLLTPEQIRRPVLPRR